MIAALPLPVKRIALNKWAILITLFYVGIVWYALRTHIIWESVNVLIGIMVLPVATIIRKGRTGSLRYAYMALAIAICCITLPVKTLLYLSVGMALLYVVETFLGSTHFLSLLVIGMMSPIFHYMANIFSFPVRLWLTKIAGTVMRSFGMDIVAKGNMLLVEGSEFSVDQACMGLNMLVTCLLLQIMLIAVYQKKYAKQLSFGMVMLFLAGITGLNMIANLIRIILLVSFKWMPETWMHEAAGIICFLVYVIVPSILFTRWLTNRHGRVVKREEEEQVESETTVYKNKISQWWSNHKQVIVHTTLAITVAIAAWQVVQRDHKSWDATAGLPAVEGYKVQRVFGDVVKLENKQALVYIKGIEGFYSADHHPSICWRGSGYEFTQIEEDRVNGIPVFTAVLTNGNDKLYTAWWYDSGHRQTINQFSWRWDALRSGKQYALINISAESRATLGQKIREIKERHLLKELLLP